MPAPVRIGCGTNSRLCLSATLLQQQLQEIPMRRLLSLLAFVCAAASLPAAADHLDGVVPLVHG
jgi:hypothetical protein